MKFIESEPSGDFYFPTFTAPALSYVSPPRIQPVADSVNWEALGGYPVGGSGLDTGLQIRPVADSINWEAFGSGPSRVGPTASAPYYGNISPFLRAGSMFGRGGSAAFRSVSGRAQSGFTVDEQERLRRRKKRSRFDY